MLRQTLFSLIIASCFAGLVAAQELRWIGEPEDFLPRNIGLQMSDTLCSNELDSCMWVNIYNGIVTNQWWDWELREGVHFTGGTEVEVFYSHLPCKAAISQMSDQVPPPELLGVIPNSSYDYAKTEVCVWVRDKYAGTELEYCFNAYLECGICSDDNYLNCRTIEQASKPISEGGCKFCSEQDLRDLNVGIETCNLPCTDPACPPDTSFRQTMCGIEYRIFHNPQWYAFVAKSRIVEVDAYIFNCIGAGVEFGMYSESLPIACIDAGFSFGCNIPSFESKVIVGNTYFVWVDGIRGSTCEYELVVRQDLEFSLDAPAGISAFSTCRSMQLTEDDCLQSDVIAVLPGEEIQFDICSQDYYGINADFAWSSSTGQQWLINPYNEKHDVFGPTVVAPTVAGTYTICLEDIELSCQIETTDLCLDFLVQDTETSLPSIDDFTCQGIGKQVQFSWKEQSDFNYLVDLSQLETNLTIIDSVANELIVTGFQDPCQIATLTLVVTNSDLPYCNSITKTIACRSSVNPIITISTSDHRTTFLNCEPYNVAQLSVSVENETNPPDGSWTKLDGQERVDAGFRIELKECFFDPNELKVGNYQIQYNYINTETSCIDKQVFSFEIIPCYPNDIDGDGYSGADDCDDQNEDVFPGNPEVCDGYDNNCDGEVDEGFNLTKFYEDNDGDGFGVKDKVVWACRSSSMLSTRIGDCDDYNVSIYPGAYEDCDDGLDNNCNGKIDEVFGRTELSCELTSQNTVIINWDHIPDAFAYYVTVNNEDRQLIFNNSVRIFSPDSISIIRLDPLFDPPANGCVVSNEITCLYSSATNLTPIKQLSIYPNPTTDKINIKTDLQNLTYKLITANGQLVKSGQLTGNSIDVARLIPGVYFIVLSSAGQQQIVQRIVKI